LGVKGVEKFEKLLVGGTWYITLKYFFEEDQKSSPFLWGLGTDPDAEHGPG